MKNIFISVMYLVSILLLLCNVNADDIILFSTKNTTGITFPDNMNFTLILNERKKEVKFDLQRDEYSIEYNPPLIIRGKSFKKKIFKLNLTDIEKKVIFEYIIRNKVTLITDGNVKNAVSIYKNGLPSDEHYAYEGIYKFALKYNDLYSSNNIEYYGNDWNCSIKSLTSFVSLNNNANTLWGLYQITELILNKRGLSFNFDTWILRDLLDILGHTKNAKLLLYPNDILPKIFYNERLKKNPEKLKQKINLLQKAYSFELKLFACFYSNNK